MTGIAEYIERKALRDYLYDADAITMESIKIITQFPSADAVEVVRCKDCINSYDDLVGLCGTCGPYVDCVVQPDFYCADGRRGSAARGVE